jgi:hypothetical protein
MNRYYGFTLIQMAALIMILGLAVIVLSRYFTADYAVNHQSRYIKAVNEAEKELGFYFSNYRFMPETTDIDVSGKKHEDKSFMKDGGAVELIRRFNPAPGLGEQILYLAAGKHERWDGDICSTLPHPPILSAIFGEDNFSVSVIYCEESLRSDGTCLKERYKVDGLLYIIVHPGEDTIFSSKVLNNKLYVPIEGSDDIIRYMPLKEGFDLADCASRIARIPRQDKRYTNRDMKADSVSRPNTSPPIIRTYSTIDENTKSPSVCQVPPEDLHTSLLRYVLCEAIDIGEGGSANSRYSSCKIRFDAISCYKSRIEYPLNRFGESFPFEKCCIEVSKSRMDVNYIPYVPMTSNCSIKFTGNNEHCNMMDEYSWKDLKGETPYLEFFSAIVGLVGRPTDRNDNPMRARLSITLANGNRYYRLNDDATIHRVPPEIPD